jgi:hypothetical protein
MLVGLRVDGVVAGDHHVRPWGKEGRRLMPTFAAWCSRKLRPSGGLLLLYTGHSGLFSYRGRERRHDLRQVVEECLVALHRGHFNVDEKARMTIINQKRAVVNGFLSSSILNSILSAIRQESQASGQAERSHTLEIDGIRHLQNSGGHFVYRIILSNPVNFIPEQVLRFRVRHSKEAILATVLVSDDEGLVLETEHALPTDAKLVSVTFDPRFIYRALGEYLEKAGGTSISGEFLDRRLTPLPAISYHPRHGLNQEQSLAVDGMMRTDS